MPGGEFLTALVLPNRAAHLIDARVELVDRGQGHPVACHFAEAVQVVGGDTRVPEPTTQITPPVEPRAVSKKRSGS